MMFHQTPDAIVFIRGDDLKPLYNDTESNFEWDFEVTLPELPSGADERIYVPIVRHALQNREGLVTGGPMPWPFGDQAIANVAKALERQQQRQPPLPPPPPPVPEVQPADLPPEVRQYIADQKAWQEQENRRLANMRQHKGARK